MEDNDEDTKALIQSIADSPDLDEEDKALIQSIKQDYGMVTTEKPKKKSLLERGLNKLDSIGTEVNQNTEDWASRSLGDTLDPVEQASVLGNKGLKSATDILRPAGEKLDSILGAFNQGSKILGKLSPKAKIALDSAMLPASKTIEETAAQIPRTPMQTAFLGLTLPFTELETMGNGIVSAGKRMVGKAASVSEKTIMGALRTPAQRYPESKLAQRLEKLFAGSEGEGKFNIINTSAENAERQAIGKAHIADAELAQGVKEEGQIVEKLTDEVAGVRQQQDKLLRAAELKKNAAGSDLSKSLGINSDKQARLEAASAMNEQQLNMATKSKSAQKAAIDADLALDKTFDLVDKDKKGIYVGQSLRRAKFEAEVAVSKAYKKTQDLGKLVTADTKALNEAFGDMRASLIEKLKVNPEDVRAQKILGVLEDGTTPPLLGRDFADSIKVDANVLKDIKGKDVKLSDLLQLYSDLNELHRDKGDRVYGEAKNLVRKHLRAYEEIPWNKAIIDAWDGARQKRMELNEAFENDTIKKLIDIAEEGTPASLFNQLISPKESTIPLQRFMKVAPKDVQVLVRRESLDRGLSAIDTIDGKSSANLEKWVGSVGEGNVELLHKGQDLDALQKLASANDSIFAANKASPGIKKEINDILEENGKLARDYAKRIDHTDAAVSRHKNSVFNKLRGIEDKAREDIQARRELTVELIEKNLGDLEKAFEIRAKPSVRAVDAGKMVINMDRKDDAAADLAIGAGAATLMASGVAELGGIHVSKYVKGGAAMAIAAGMAKKSPRVMSNLYYSERGRKIMERIASAPSSKDAAMALLDLAVALKNPGLYLTVKPQMNDKPGKEGPNLGKLGVLRGRNRAEANQLNSPNETPDQLKAEDRLEMRDSEEDGEIPKEL